MASTLARDVRIPDVVVVGGGFAGLTAAIRAQELGSTVTLLDAGSNMPGWSNSRMSGARWHIAYLSPTTPPDLLASKINTLTAGVADQHVVAAFTRNAARTFGWAQDHGARFASLKGMRVMMPIRPNRRGNAWRGWGADLMLRRMSAEFLARGGNYRHEHRVIELLVRGRRVIGVRAERADGGVAEQYGRAVVLADGGYQGDPDLLRSESRVARPDLLVMRGAGTGRGDGLRVAQAVGARIAGTDALYGHLLHGDARTNPQLSPYPMLDALSIASIVVGPDGQRLYDEQLGGVAGANRIARLPDPSSTWLIFDKARWETAAKTNQIVPPNPNIVQAGARIERGDDPAELARRTGMNAQSLARTIDGFNAAALAGRGDALPVQRTGDPRPLSGPLFAVPIAVGLTHTLGGPAIDADTRVTDASGRPIPGLFAAGSMASGLSGGPKPGYAGGISVAFGLGLIAGEAASRVEAAAPAAAP
jgi:fumarate reductase flavoprotein subunit